MTTPSVSTSNVLALLQSLGIHQHPPTVELCRRNGLHTRRSLSGVSRVDLQALGFSFGTANEIANAVKRKPPKKKRAKKRSRSKSVKALQPAPPPTAHRHTFCAPPLTPPNSRTVVHAHRTLVPTWKPRVYLSHTWAKDTLGRDTHARIHTLHNALVCSAKVDSWFDTEQMNGDVTHTMCNGIDGCDIVIVCVTRAFIDKCEQVGNSNCKLELHYAYERKGAARLLPLVLEADCLDTRTWNGPLGMYLNKRFYLSCTTDDEMLRNVGAIVKEVYHLVQRPLPDTSTATATNPRTVVAHWCSTVAARKHFQKNQ